MRRLLGFLALVGLVVSACSSSSDRSASTSTSAGSTAATAPPTDATVERPLTVTVEILDLDAPDGATLAAASDDAPAAVLAELRAEHDGQLPLQAALDLLASTLGDIPGADPTFESTSPHDGTMALNALRARWDELTPEQIDAIESLLAARAERSVGFVIEPDDADDGSGKDDDDEGAAAVVHPVALRPQAPSDDLATARALIEAAQAEISLQLGRPLGKPIEIQFIDDDTAAAYPAVGDRDVGDTGRDFDRCVVQLPARFNANDAAHEVFHCFQYAILNRTNQDWIIEGSAEWVGARVGGADSQTIPLFESWLVTPASLLAMDYDALGYYWTIESMGANPWSVIVDMLDDRGVAAVRASGLDPTEVLRRIVTAQWRNSNEPAPVDGTWDLTSGDAPAMGERGRVTVTPDAPLIRSSDRRAFATTGPFVVSIEEGAYVEVDITADVGALQFYDRDLVTFEGRHEQRYCLTDAACECAEEDVERGSRTMALATGELDGGSTTFSIVAEGGEAFPDGEWTGDLTITTDERLDLPDAELVARQLGGPFRLTVAEGRVVDGEYGITLAQRITFPDGEGRATGVLTGVIEGCADAPRLASRQLQIDGTITTDLGPVPISFTEDVTGPGGALLVEEVDEEAGIVTGRLPNAPYLEYMRSVGVGVNDFQILFTATRG